jgi:acetyltransferase-like isoleucine patch superfamily enzyme
LGKSVFVDSGVVIGAGCRIQNFVSIYSGVTLEDDVFVGPSAVFTNDRYPRASGGEWDRLPTLVRMGASIGANATVLCGLTIGELALVGAGAVVTADVEPHRLVVGNPAKPVGWVCRCGRGVPGGPGTACPACGEDLAL